jgi:voltage-dependent potassium channel beta subunit
MPYRRLGSSGLNLSALSFGSWVSFGDQLDLGNALECMSIAREAGVNFFDNAENYGDGAAETIMGAALARLGWPRETYVVSTKFFFGISEGPNTRETLNRKYLMQAIEGSLKRLQLDYVDIVYCHRHDPHTPLDEVVRAMSDMIVSGRALYWGTSEWPAEEIRAAWEIADRHHFHKPVVEQPEYNLFRRTKVDAEYAALYESIGLGLTTWSPLASGQLTGKYVSGVPANSRATLPGYEWLAEALTDSERNSRVRGLATIADGLGCSLAQLSIAWCAANPNVCSVITGASSADQLRENLEACALIPAMTPSLLEEIERRFSLRESV